MKPLILDIDDSALRATDNGQLVGEESGFALLDGNRVERVGRGAERMSKLHPRRIQNDFWYRLSGELLKGHEPLTRADIASAQIAALLPPERFDGRDVVLILPSYLGRDTLALLLGVVQANGLRPIAMVDAAVAATRHRYVDQVALHIELSLHCAWVARLHQTESRSTLEDVRSLEASGLLALREAWLKFFAEQFVRQCRFDPLHSAQSEQALYDKVPDWLALLESQPSSTLTFDLGGVSHSIDVERVDVINRVANHYQRIADMVRAMLAGGDTPALQMTLGISALPGFAELLTARVGGNYHVVADQASIDGISDRLPKVVLDAGRVMRDLPNEGETALAAPLAPTNGAAPTHILLDERAFALSEKPLTVGAGSASPPPRYLQMEGAPAGVSGLHCEFVIRDGQCLLLDHSRYGTFLNGNRISASAALRTGDTVRVGTPGMILQLIRAEAL